MRLSVLSFVVFTRWFVSGWLARYGAGTVLFSFLSFVTFLSLRDESIVGSVCCSCRVRPFSLSSLSTLCTSCWADCCVTTLVPTGSVLLFMPLLYLHDELLGVLTPLCRHFFLVRCYRLGSLFREACGEDATVIRNFSPFSLFSSWYFVKSWLVHRCRGYRQFFFYFPVKCVSTIETY